MFLKKISAFFLLAGLVFLSACSDSMEGNWQVVRYESSSPGKPGIALNNIGTMTFYADGTGKNSISYNLIDTVRVDTTSFRWQKVDKSITLTGSNSEFSKTWIILEDSRSKQRWTATDGNNQVQTIELGKK